MQRYRVQVPQGVGPGGQFLVNVNGQYLRVTCPQGTGPGSTIEIQAPASNVPSNPGMPPAPPPPQIPQPPQHTFTGGRPLETQCRASADAERQLGALSGPPPADLIFTAMDRDGSNSVTVEELQFGLSQGGRMRFSLKTCQLLVNMYDTDRDGSVHRAEFISLWSYVDQWRACFEAHDKDRSGNISRMELKHAIEQIGYRFSESFYDKIFRIYDKDKRNEIGFDSFIQLFCELHSLTERFKVRDTERNGKATFQYEDFLDAAYSIHE